MYDPVHGSAPEIAGLGSSESIAAMVSFAFMFKFSFNKTETAEAIETAVAKTLDDGFRSADIATTEKPFASKI